MTLSAVREKTADQFQCEHGGGGWQTLHPPPPPPVKL